MPNEKHKVKLQYKDRELWVIECECQDRFMDKVHSLAVAKFHTHVQDKRILND